MKGVALKSVDENAFSHCDDLEIVLPDELPVIKKKTFYEFKMLYSVKLPGKLEVICEEAFAGCVNLPSIDIPRTIRKIEKTHLRIAV